MRTYVCTYVHVCADSKKGGGVRGSGPPRILPKKVVIKNLKFKKYTTVKSSLDPVGIPTGFVKMAVGSLLESPRPPMVLAGPPL